MEKNTNFSTLAILIIKDIRLAKQIHQGFIAQQLGKTPSAWTKIENGQAQLSFDSMIGACIALQIKPADLMYLVEYLARVFNQYGFFFHYGNSNNEDDLLPLGMEFFNTCYPKALNHGLVSSLSLLQNFPIYVIPTFVRYCIDPDYKKTIDFKVGGDSFYGI